MYVCMGLQRKGKDTKWDMTSEAGVFSLSRRFLSRHSPRSILWRIGHYVDDETGY